MNKHFSNEDIPATNKHEKMLNITNYDKMKIKTAMINHLTLVRMAISKKLEIAHAGKAVEKGKCLYTVMGSVN